jgi:LPS-assembly protein
MRSRRLAAAVLAALALSVSHAAAQQTTPAQTPPDPLRNCNIVPFMMRAFLAGATERIRETNTFRITGNVVINCDDITLYADEVEWSETDQLVKARGRVTFEQPGVRITADRLELNNTTKLGVFYGADGTAQITRKASEPRSLFGTQEPEVHFWAERLERVAEKRYEIQNGGFSTCIQPTERWTISGKSLTVVLDDYVLLRSAIMRVKNVPMFYLPVMYYPLGEDDRSSGFLLPSYTQSSALGTGFSNAFFWAISRSQDATFYHTWYSKAGQSFGGEYRFVSAPGSDGQVTFNLVNEPASLANSRRAFDLRGNINQAMPRGFRLIGRTYYFNSIRTQQTYQQNLIALSQQWRDFDFTVGGNVGRYRVDAQVQQYDLFQDVNSINRSGKRPSVRVSAPDRPIGRSRVYFGATGEAIQIIRHADLRFPSTDQSLWRFDALPTIRAPLSTLPFLSVATSASWRLTHWRESLDPTTPGTPQIDQPLTRQLLDLKADVTGPVLSRVYTAAPDNGYAERFKHLIEPRVSLQWLSPFDRIDEVVKSRIDNVDQLVGGTTTLSYSLTNRVLARRKRAGGASDVREILSVVLAQTYYTNAAAAAADPNNVNLTVYPFTPLTLSVITTPDDGVRADFRMELDPQFRQPREYRASGMVTRGLTQVTAGWSKRMVIEGLPFFGPAQATHFLNAAAALSDRDRRIGGRYEMYYNLKLGTFAEDRMLVYYNSQCCGIAVDYRNTRPGQGSVFSLPGNRTLNLIFTLAGIGSFANPFGAFGNNSGR